jgi:excisionase family DNA binding protein
MTDHPNDKLAYTVNAFCRAIGLGRTKIYQLIKQGQIRTVRIGGRRLVPKTEAQRLLNEGGAHDSK